MNVRTEKDRNGLIINLYIHRNILKYIIRESVCVCVRERERERERGERQEEEVGESFFFFLIYLKRN